MRRRSPQSVAVSVKSSLRTLQILEYIDARRRGVTIAELVDALKAPQSSVSTLVQSMINAGYLAVGHDQRQILPTSRVAALGSWIEPVISGAEIRALMLAIGERTGQTILLGVPTDLCVRYIDVVPGRHAMRLDIPIGTRLPLMEAGMGRLLLSEMPEQTVRELWTKTRDTIRKHGAEGLRPSDVSNLWNAAPKVSPLSSVFADIDLIRRRGYAISLGRISYGAGIVCVALPRNPLDPPIGLGIGGLSELIERDADDLLDIIHKEATALNIPLKLVRTSATNKQRSRKGHPRGN
ncbi:MAG: helix-turn-helix domain-containing protein [Rhodopseudomonas palustris]|uniref:Helix-turn-helix domain-containing protein n=1 Tax=Rhodopseudomonas palustris TaxID=1076 RepID=A0A933W3V3_RHOPL|nr:helix-turn-helix domain-containing protein [Rhodopseudomonas palustris]